MRTFQLLLVEDNPAEVMLFRQALRSANGVVHVTVAYDGERALELLGDSEVRPDLIVLDLNLPKVDGFTILEHVESREHPPVVVFSNSSHPGDRRRAIALGAVDYVIKPSSGNEYFASVHAMVERWLDPGKYATNGVS